MPTVQPIIGSNLFYGVPFPLVLADRFFHIYHDGGKGFKIDVFRWDPGARAATYEVRGSAPLQEEIAANPTGIVTFNGTGGEFQFKFRPKPGVSQIFGHVPIQDELTAQINDRQIRVIWAGIPRATLERNTMSGMPIGIQVHADGRIAIGVNRLPDGMVLPRERA
jgi:hypothetical protein